MREVEVAECRHCEISLVRVNGGPWLHDTMCLERGCRAALFTVDEEAWLAWNVKERRSTYAAPVK